MENKYPFDIAVADYVGRLTDEQQKVLQTGFLNPQAEEDWPWFAEVIFRYNLRDKQSPVRRDINERVEPDPYGVNSLLWAGVGNAEPIFEAMTLLNSVQKMLRKKHAA